MPAGKLLRTSDPLISNIFQHSVVIAAGAGIFYGIWIAVLDSIGTAWGMRLSLA